MWNLKESIEQLFPQVVSWRRQLHMHPEIANQEVRTSQLITSVLENAGIQVTHVLIWMHCPYKRKVELSSARK